MKPPIVIIEGDAVTVHPSTEHVTTFLEPQDVSDGIFMAYDSEDWLLDLTVKSVKCERQFLWFRWVESYPGIVISEYEPATDGSVELRRRLIRYLSVVLKKKPKESDIPTASLDKLVQGAGSYILWRVSPQDP